jgi:hypothetical protein
MKRRLENVMYSLPVVVLVECGLSKYEMALHKNQRRRLVSAARQASRSQLSTVFAVL